MVRVQRVLRCNFFRRLIIVLAAAGAVPSLWSKPAAAADFAVRSAETFLDDKVYYLDADIAYKFSDAALDALQHGVTLVVLLEIEINRERDYLWSENIASLRQRYQIAYEALTGRYAVTNLNSGADTYYPTRAAAVAALGDIDRLPLLDAGRIGEHEHYSVALHVSLDRDALPVPMRVMGYFSSDWRLASEWYTWPLR